MSYSKWFRNCIFIFCGAVLGLFLLVLIVDPYFHYHSPIGSYRFYEPRFTNDGISRNFDYDTVIMGTSMSQNFKCSLIDELFEAKSVKMPLVGATYKELSRQIERALRRNSDLKTVFWAMDENALLNASDMLTYELPEYLYDENPLNDAAYIYNKDMFYHALIPDILMTVRGEEPISMDEYNSSIAPLGIGNFYSGHTPRADGEQTSLSNEERKEVKKNVNSNFLRVINAYPQTTFYIFIPPYSIYWWEHREAEGELDKYIEAQKIAEELLLQCPNVRLYSFWGKTEVIENMDNYRDSTHYSSEVSDDILRWMKNDEGLLTRENYLFELEKQAEYLHSFDYYGFFEAFDE